MGMDSTIFSERKEGDQWVLCPSKAVKSLSEFSAKGLHKLFVHAPIKEFEHIREGTGLPTDCAAEIQDTYNRSLENYGGLIFTQDFGHCWVTVERLLSFDWDKEYDIDKSYRSLIDEWLGSGFFDVVDDMHAQGVERLVMWFDN